MQEEMETERSAGKKRWLLLLVLVGLLLLGGWWWQGQRQLAEEVVPSLEQKEELTGMGVNHDEWLPDAIAKDENQVLEMKFGN